MRTRRAQQRTGAALVLACCVGTSVVGLGGTASASTSKAPALAAAWWWDKAAPSVNGTALPAGAPAPASGVP